MMSIRLRVSWQFNQSVGPPYCRAEMYAGRVACCPLVSHPSMLTGQTDGRTDARPLHYGARRVQRNKW